MKTMKKNQEAFVKTLSHPETELRAQAIRWMMEKMLICALFVDATVLTGKQRVARLSWPCSALEGSADSRLDGSIC
jgi:hypothetical protein